MYMADLAVAYPYLSANRANASRAVRGNPYDACDQAKIEWYLGNERIRSVITPHFVDHMAFGVTGPEAMHSDVKRWFCNLRNPEPRPSTRGIPSGYGGRPFLLKGGRVYQRIAGRYRRPTDGRRAALEPIRDRGGCSPPHVSRSFLRKTNEGPTNGTLV